MPTPVSTARECLTEEAARALDDAVSVARRRSHAQTSSLHAVSSLLTMPSSLLRQICISRTSPYSSRLQFRALELSVGVSLDRLPSSKSSTAEEEPPVSNSLMAAIKRSQANQRRHPETYHLHQIHANSGGCQTTVLKVELKYFILAILDDPIVSRVFGEAGFRSSDIKLDVLHPPVTQFTSRFSRARYPPLFLCNLQNSDPGREFDENCKRIGEVLGREERKNPLLVGNCANEALKSMADSINKRKLGFLPVEIGGLSVISIEKEISEILGEESGNEEEIRVKFDELGRIVEENCLKSRVLLNIGDFKVLTSEASSTNAVESLVSKISDLLKKLSKKLWIIGFVSSNETYTKLLQRFPTMDKDWDLQILPITSAVYPKSSLMGSFVPFGGFFSSTSDFRAPGNQTVSRCHLCNEKYEQELAAIVKAGSSISLTDQSSEKLPSWLRVAELETDKGMTSKAMDEQNTLASQTKGLQKKWDNICQSIHQTTPFPKLSFLPVKPQFPVQLAPSKTELSGSSIRSKTPESETRKELNTPLSSKPKLSDDLTSSMTNRTASSPLSCVTTDLGLGVIYSSKIQESNTQVSQESREKPLLMSLKSSLEHKDFKSLRELLSRRVSWQMEAVNIISQIICECKSDSRRSNTSVWLALLGPDKIGKKKVALALAEVFYGGQVNCICVDFRVEYCLDDKFRGKTVVDYIAGELARKPHSVLFLENVEKAEFPDQISLSSAMRTGKLRNSHGREISMKNLIVLMTSGVANDKTDQVLESVKFSEEEVLNARSWKLQIKVDNIYNVVKFGLNKRKQESETEKTALRPVKTRRSYLDLNLPVNETDTTDANSSSNVWFDDFIEELDGKVMFKAVDFDGLAKNIQEKIILEFRQYFVVPETHLEIDNEVILQILAASWSNGEDKTVDEWLKTVLGPSFAEARQKYGSNQTGTVKLVSLVGEEEAGAVELPVRVDVV